MTPHKNVILALSPLMSSSAKAGDLLRQSALWMEMSGSSPNMTVKRETSGTSPKVTGNINGFEGDIKIKKVRR